MNDRTNKNVDNTHWSVKEYKEYIEGNKSGKKGKYGAIKSICRRTYI